MHQENNLIHSPRFQNFIIYVQLLQQEYNILKLDLNLGEYELRILFILQQNQANKYAYL